MTFRRSFDRVMRRAQVVAGETDLVGEISESSNFPASTCLEPKGAYFLLSSNITFHIFSFRKQSVFAKIDGMLIARAVAVLNELPQPFLIPFQS